MLTNSWLRASSASAILAVAVFACAGAAARAGTMNVLVPAYFYPGTGGSDGQGDGWAEMAASAGKVGITAILDPDTGPGPSPDPNYAAAIANLERAGGAVVAYVDTWGGRVPVDVVESQIKTYLSQYPGRIQGFFIDQMSTAPEELAYYQQVYDFVKALDPTYRVIGNPGVVTDQSFVSAANSLVTFEQDAAAFAIDAPPAWVHGYPASTFGALVSGQYSVTGMVADVALADERNVGYVYITDQSLATPVGYLYDRLPSYWNEEVAVIAAAAPEPGALALATLGFVAMAGAARFGWRRFGDGSAALAGGHPKPADAA